MTTKPARPGTGWVESGVLGCYLQNERLGLPASRRRGGMMTGIVTSTMVARKFLDVAEGNDPLLTPLKLMKLVYICHGWHLAIFNDPLVSEEVEAWPNGPVFRELYIATERFGKSRVQEVLETPSEVDLLKRGLIGELNENVQTIIGMVSKEYKENTGGELSAFSHLKGTPWYDTCKKYGGTDDAPVISNDLIKDYYSKMLER